MDAAARAASSAGAPTAATLSYTLAIVKPDAAGRWADEILHLTELSGFTVVQQQRLQLTVARAEAFSAEHRARPFFPGLVEFMTSAPVVAAVLARPGAVGAWRALIGPTNSLEARVRAPKRRAMRLGARHAHGEDSCTCVPGSTHAWLCGRPCALHGAQRTLLRRQGQRRPLAHVLVLNP